MRFKKLIEHLEAKPGIYKMCAKGTPIYIGKAKNLQNRLKQYFQNKPSSYRIQVMLSQVDDLQVVITESESEALILENRLIKEYQPKYNILLKDDKSFPVIVFSQHEFPRLYSKRVKSIQKNESHYGPYMNQKQVIGLIEQMQKIFQIRNCSDHFFRNRMRPCMQYEIGRCRAPCVGYINKKTYAKDVSEAKKLLKGQLKEYQSILTERMYAYAEEKAFEQAGACRDLLQSLKQSTQGQGNFTVFYQDVLGTQMGVVIMQVVNEKIHQIHTEIIDFDQKHVEPDWLESYIYAHYQKFTLAKKIVALVENTDRLEQALGKTTVISLQDKRYQTWLDLAIENLQAYRQAQSDKMFQWATFWGELEALLKHKVDRILCIDISHHQGSGAYGAVVVCGANGMEKQAFRAYKVPQDGDDYGAIREVLLHKIKAASLSEQTVVIIDGGKGQINSAKTALADRGITLPLFSISKGVERIWGEEKFYCIEKDQVSEFSWPKSLLKYILHIRDEAHQFAISTHRRALRKQTLQSVLDKVEGIGKEKKRSLLGYFGGLEAIKCARLSEIEKVPGIGKALAKRIYDMLRVD